MDMLATGQMVHDKMLEATQRRNKAVLMEIAGRAQDAQRLMNEGEILELEARAMMRDVEERLACRRTGSSG